RGRAFAPSAYLAHCSAPQNALTNRQVAISFSSTLRALFLVSRLLRPDRGRPEVSRTQQRGFHRLSRLPACEPQFGQTARAAFAGGASYDHVPALEQRR